MDIDKLYRNMGIFYCLAVHHANFFKSIESIWRVVTLVFLLCKEIGIVTFFRWEIGILSCRLPQSRIALARSIQGTPSSRKSLSLLITIKSSSIVLSLSLS